MRTSKVFAIAGLAAGVLFVAPRPIAAQLTSCSTGALKVCAAFEASLADGNKTLILKVWNLYDGTTANGVSHVITFAGLGLNWSGTAELASATYDGSSPAWIVDNSPNHNPVGREMVVGAQSAMGVTEGLVGCSQGTPPGKYRTCLAGPYLMLTFTSDTEFNLTNAVFGWQSQTVDGLTGCSMWVDSNGKTVGGTATECSGSVTPEPVTIVLLATGLMGIGGVGIARRRRGRDVTSV